MKIYAFIGFFFLLLTSCKLEILNKEEGEIEYNINYISNKTSVPTYLLPKTLILKYKNKKNIISIEGFMGQFIIINIIDQKENTNTTLFKIVDKKYVSITKDSYPYFYASLKNLKFEETNEEKDIIGFNCKKVKAYYDGDKNNNFDVYYTNIIKINNPNKNNPYESISGILMQFNIKVDNMEMQLIANKHIKRDIKDSEFDIPSGYKKINNKKLTDLISQLLE